MPHSHHMTTLMNKDEGNHASSKGPAVEPRVGPHGHAHCEEGLELEDLFWGGAILERVCVWVCVGVCGCVWVCVDI